MLATGTRYAIVGVQLQENELDYWLIVAIGGTLFGFIVGRFCRWTDTSRRRNKNGPQR